MVDINQVIAWVMAQANEMISQAKLLIKRHDFFSIMTAVTLVVRLVEEATAQYKGLTGAEKKQIAATVLNRLIDIPYVPETVEQWVFEFVIDQAVTQLNRIGALKQVFGSVTISAWTPKVVVKKVA